MLTLTFNTTTKTVSIKESSIILFNFDNIPTVKIKEGFYEVIQKDILDKTLPIARFPIQNTIMLIEK